MPLSVADVFVVAGEIGPADGLPPCPTINGRASTRNDGKCVLSPRIVAEISAPPSELLVEMSLYSEGTAL
jgi:hypothetical protein